MEKNYNFLHEPDIFARPPGSSSWRNVKLLSNFTKKRAVQLVVLLMALNALPAFAQTYCTPAPTSVDNQGIINVTIGTINNTTVAEPGNYADYSAQIVNVGQTVTQPFSITYGTGFTYDTKIWVDWNNDGDFVDAGEEVYTGTSLATNPTTLTGTFTVPATATLGNHRLRVGGVDFGPPTPCWTATYGSFEDYTINVTTPPSCPAPSNAVGTALVSGSANLSWTAPAVGTPVGYEYVVDTNVAAPTGAGTPVTGTSVTAYTPIVDNTFYYLHVRANCGATDGYSTWITSPRFRYLLGDTCTTAVDLGALTSPLSGTTAGAASDYAPTCSFSNNAPDVYYSIQVPVGSTLVIGLTASGYDSVHAVFYGTCAASTQIACTDTELGNTTWENTTGSTQTVYWVQDGYNTNSGTYTLAWTLTAAPACNVPRTLAAALTNATTANLSWAVPVTGTPTGYEYAVTTSATPPATGTATTATTVTGVTVATNVTSYLHVRTVCGTDGFSTWVTFPFYSGICIPAPVSRDGQGIVNVTIGSINNTTVGEVGNYGNYTSQIVNVGQGVTQAFSITYATGFTYDTKIWVDWNDNMNFNDPGEEVYVGVSLNTNPTTLSGTFTVPVTAALGNHRLRVGGVDVGPATPCYTGTYGTFEDYTINVTVPPTCFTPSNAAGVALVSGSANLSWTAPTLGGTPVGYEYIVDTVQGAPTVAGTPVTGTTVTGYTPIVDNTFYYLHVRTNCGGSFSEWITSPRFRFLAGESCATAVSLDALTSPLSSTTVGATSDYAPTCSFSSNAPDVFYSIQVPVGSTLVIGLTASGYDSVHAVFYGTCAASTQILCTDPELGNTTWENTTGSTQTVYWVQDGYNANSGTYTLAWTLTAAPACNVPRTLAATLTNATTANVSWAVPVTGTPTGYEYAVTNSATPPATGTATTATSVTGITVTTNVMSYLHVRTVCGTDGFSTWVTFPFYSGICIPAPTSVDNQGIVNVTIGSINNTTVAEPGNYANYTSQIVNVGQGVTQAFSITYATGFTYDTKIWVDWNDNMNFNDPGEEVYVGVSLAANPTTLTGTFTVPVTAALGNHRLRVGGVDFGPATPCWTAAYGSFEDYTINVTVPPTCFTPSNAVGVATAPGTANLSWTAPVLGNTPAGYEYVVDMVAAAPTVAGTPVTGTTVTGYTGLTDNTYYYLHVRANCGNGDFSEWITSPRFRYLQGDTCASAINLNVLTSPYSFSTVGAGNDYTPTCHTTGNAPDLFYYITVPNGYTLNIGLTASGYDAVHSIFYGDCTAANQTAILCTDSDLVNTSWENLTGSSQTVYWVQDGWAANAGTFTLGWTLTGPATCDVPRNPTVNITSLTSVNVSWTVPNTGSPAGYEYAVTNSQNPPASGTYTTSLSAANVAVTPNTTSYLHVRSVCGAVDGNSLWVSTSFFTGYCVPSNSGSTANYISGITTTGGETNFSNTGTGFSGFTDYTQSFSVSTYAGGTFNITATHPGGNKSYTVWVDWNNDFDFDDEGETEIVSNFLASPVAVGTVSVPATAAVGNYRMRIRNATTGSPTPACGNFLFGEAEDYTLQVVATPTCFPPYGLMIEPIGATSADLRWSPPVLSFPTGYQYVLSNSATPPASGTFTTAFYIPAVTYNPAQSVYLHVRSVCGGNDFSNWETTAILGSDSPELLANNVIVFKGNSAINVTSASTLIKSVNVFDTRGRKLYSQGDINAFEAVIDGMQIQQQVLIIEVTTEKGKVSKRIVY
jgi:hypothetical protein